MQDIPFELPIPVKAPARARPKTRRRSIVREIIDTLVLIGAIYALVNLATARFIIQGPSMRPNFETGQFLIVSRLSYLLGNPERGDIVVFHVDNRGAEEDYIKRIIGVPGDEVQIIDGQVIVNGEAIEEVAYINEPGDCRNRCNYPPGDGAEPLVVGPEQYFVLGDNRNHSSDSRSIGLVDESNIVGEALIRYWPPSEWGIVQEINFPGDNSEPQQ